MTKIEGFNRQTVRLVQEGAVKALADYAKKLGLTVKAVGGSFDDNILTAKIQFTVTEREGQKVDPAADDFRKYATVYDLQPADLGRVFLMRGEEYTVAGLLMYKRSKPVLVTRSRDKKRFSMTPEDVARLLHVGTKAERAPLLDFPNAAVRGAA